MSMLLGHPAGDGDDLIRSFDVNELNKRDSGSDLAFRRGGNEFLVLIPEGKPVRRSGRSEPLEWIKVTSRMQRAVR